MLEDRLMKVAWCTSGRPYTREGESTITPEMTEAQGQKTSGKAWRAALKANRVHMNPLVRAKYRLESNTITQTSNELPSATTKCTTSGATTL